jgi:hypothetical protein
VGAALILLSAYLAYRFPHLSSEVSGLEEQSQRVSSDITGTKLPRLVGRDAESFQRESSDTSISLESHNRMLGVLESRLVNQSSPEAIQELLLAVAELANDCGVRIERSLPGVLDHPPRNPLGRGLVIGEVYSRPLRQLELVGSFYGIRDFILRLERLPKMANLLRVSIRQTQSDTDEGSLAGYLRAELLVAF